MRTGRPPGRDSRRAGEPATRRTSVIGSPARTGPAVVRPTTSSALGTMPAGTLSGGREVVVRSLRRTTVPAGRSCAAVSTCLVGGGAGAAACSPTSTAKAAVVAASRRRRARSARRRRRRRDEERLSRPEGLCMPAEARQDHATVRRVVHRVRRRRPRPSRASTRRTTRSRWRTSRSRWRRTRSRCRSCSPWRGTWRPSGCRCGRSRALEHHAHGVEDLAQAALALGAARQRVLGEALDLLEGVVALGAGVLVGRHAFLR